MAATLYATWTDRPGGAGYQKQGPWALGCPLVAEQLSGLTPLMSVTSVVVRPEISLRRKGLETARLERGCSRVSPGPQGRPACPQGPSEDVVR